MNTIPSNLTALTSEAGLGASLAGWMAIAIAWSILGTLWIAGGLLTARRASQSTDWFQPDKSLEAAHYIRG